MGAPTRHRGRSRYPTRSRNAGAASTTPAPSFDPLVDITWRAAWFAEDPDWIAPADGGVVDQWDDGSGNALHLTASTTARPTYRATYAGLNSRPALEFDGSANVLVSANVTIAQPYSLIVIAKADANTSTGVMGRSTGGSTPVLTMHSSTSSKARFSAGAAIDAPNSLGSTKGLLVAFASGASSAIEANGQATAANAGANGWTGSFAVSVGGTSGTAFFDGAVSFAAIYTAGTGDVRAAAGWAGFEAWAALHYGLTIA